MTEAINPANPYGATTEEVFGGETLTGEALMIYITSRLNSLDEDINALMGQQHEAIAKKEYLNVIRDWANQVKAAADSGELEQRTDLHTFPPAPPGMEAFGAELLEAWNGLSGAETKGVTDESVQAFHSKLDSVLDEINGASELNMIRLQQCMGQRQTCIQLTTNCMSKLSSGYEAIVANLR